MLGVKFERKNGQKNSKKKKVIELDDGTLNLTDRKNS